MTTITELRRLNSIYMLFFLLSSLSVAQFFENWPNDLKLHICLALPLALVRRHEKKRASNKGRAVAKHNAQKNAPNPSAALKILVATMAGALAKAIRTTSALRQEGEVPITVRAEK